MGMSDVKSVEEHLRDVDYKYDPEYNPSKFAVKVINFIKMMTDGKGESSPTPVVHYRMLDLLANKDIRVANLCARGVSKTTIFAEVLFFYIAVFGKIEGFGEVDAIIYVSDTIENGVKGLKKNMEFRYENSEFLQTYLPKVTFNQNEIYLTNIDGRKTGIKMFGASTGLRGTKIMAKRPQLAVLDDLLSDKNAKSEGIIDDIENTLFKGVNHALDPTHKKIVFNGTPFHQGDPLYKAIGSGAWRCNVFPICEQFPVSREEFHGAWESRFGYDFVRGEYELAKKEGMLHAFYQELMLSITSEEDMLVHKTDILWFDRSKVLQHKDRYHIYITTDFATSTSKSSDFSAISVWALNSAGHYFWIDGVMRRQTMDMNIDDLFRLCHKYNPMSVGVELNGQQGGFIPWIQQEMIDRDIFFTLAKTIGANGKATRIGILSPNNQNKLDRFNVMLPILKAGKFWLPKDLQDTDIIREAVNELFNVTHKGITSRHDDWLDTFSMLGLMQTSYPAGGHEEPVKDDDDPVYNEYWYSEEDDSSNPDSNTYYV